MTHHNTKQEKPKGSSKTPEEEEHERKRQAEIETGKRLERSGGSRVFGD
jgi:hypothetical protein